MFDRETEEAIGTLADELYEGLVEDEALRYFEGGVVRSAPTGAPPEYITVEVEGIYDENVMWRGVPASLVVGDEVLVWENPITHRREIHGGSGATTTSTASPWQKVTVAVSGADFALLSAAIAWINALPGAIGPSATRLFAINMLGGTFVEAADVTIPQYVHVGGEGEGTVLDMGDATLRLAADTSLQEIVVTSTANDTASVIIVQGNNAVMDDVRVIITGGPNQECVYFNSVDNVELYHVVCEATTGTSYAFNVYDSTVLFWDCHVDDTTNFWLGIYVSTAGNPSTITTMFCDFHTSTHDVWVLASNVWNHFCCNFDPANVTIAGTQNALRHGKTRFADKVYAGTFGAPVDVQVTEAGEYGFALYYSGNNYNVTGLRSRAFLVTTDAAARTVQGAKLQASNSDGIDAGVVQGAIVEGIGKSNATPSTITDLRGALINTEWDAQETVTDLKTLYVRTHTRNSAAAGYISNTGYLLYLENEAVGGNGQMLDAAIYVKATNVSTPMAFDYGLDFTGAANEINTADIRFSGGALMFEDAAMQVYDNVADAWRITDAGGLEYMRVVSTDANPYYCINPAGAAINVGIGLQAPLYGLEAITANGFFVLSDTTANNTNKITRWMSLHYNNDAQNPVTCLNAFIGLNNNTLSWGGGTALGNAAMYHQWYAAVTSTAGAGTGMMRLSSNGLGIGALITSATLLELQEVETLAASPADGYAAGLTLDPGYTGAFTVTRHNYIDVQDVGLAGGAAVTDAAVMRFDAAIGTHKCLPAAFTTTDSNADTTNWAGGLLINVNGTLYKIPYIAA